MEVKKKFKSSDRKRYTSNQDRRELTNECFKQWLAFVTYFMGSGLLNGMGGFARSEMLGIEHILA